MGRRDWAKPPDWSWDRWDDFVADHHEETLRGEHAEDDDDLDDTDDEE